MKVSISKGNSKMGAIPSVSLPPIITCPKNAPCAKKCYASKLCRLYPTVNKAYQNNLEILRTNPNEYFNQVFNAVRMSRFFRFHVSGDIPNYDYFASMVAIAWDNPHCEILAFTKQYKTQLQIYTLVFGNGQLSFSFVNFLLFFGCGGSLLLHVSFL